MEISIYKDHYEIVQSEITSIDAFISQISFGKWQKQVDEIRAQSDKNAIKKLKILLPCVTPSGTFSERKENGLIKHSGFICIDVDHVANYDEEFKKISQDEYTYCAFRSCSGKGFAVFIKINSGRHLDSFLGIEQYYLEKYNIIIDPACKNVSRGRAVSFDPNIYVNEKSSTFKKYSDKRLKISPKKIPVIITGKSDFENIIQQIQNLGVDITNSSYAIFLQLGFSLASEFGEEGREYFHSVCQNSHLYSPEGCDKQYNHCLKSKGSGINIGTFYYYAKEAGLKLVSEKTKEIVSLSLIAKRGGRSKEETYTLLQDLNGISKEESSEIVDKVYSVQFDSLTNDLPKLSQIEIFLNSNYKLRRNVVTRFVENEGNELDSNITNSIYIKSRKEVDDKIKFEEIDRMIHSDFVENYNPLQDFFINRQNKEITTDWISILCQSIKSDNVYKNEFIKKWIVGIIASIFDSHSPLLLVLTGGQNTGKTEFFRRLLPPSLKNYYAESKLDAEKDSEILMCQKILILDDEFGGKSKFEAKRLKELTSKQEFTLREPYGRKNVTLRRMAVLCGTSNEDEILNDITGNRRIIPIRVNSIDFELYNSVNKEELLLQAYKLWQSDFSFELSNKEIGTLNIQTSEFEQISVEREMIYKFFKLPKNADINEGLSYLQTSEIKSIIEKMTLQKLNINRLGQELKKLGYDRVTKRVNGVGRYVYAVINVTKDVYDDEIMF